MRSAWVATAKTLLRDTHGAEIAEAAAVLPIMFMVIVGIFWFGQAFSIYGTITKAAQDGARAAVAPACTTCSSASDPSTNAYSAVLSAMTAAHLDVTKMQLPSTVPTLTSCLGSGAVSCDSSQGNMCVQGIQHSSGNLQEYMVQLAPASTGPGVCGVAVSFQYPFRFWLPFTSLNKQQIWLQAQAQVRAETQ